VRLFFRENPDEILEVSHASPRDEVEKFVVAVTWLRDVHQVISLWPRDTSDLRVSKLSDKHIIGVDDIQQLNTIDRQSAHPSYVQRTNVTVLHSNICRII